MTVSSAIEPGKVNGREWRPNKNFTDTPEEYESTLMRNLNDVKLILPTQYALPVSYTHLTLPTSDLV